MATGIRAICEAIDQIDADFDQKELIARTGTGSIVQLCPTLVDRGWLVKLPGSKPYRYRRATEEEGQPISFVGLFEKGQLEGIWAARRKLAQANGAAVYEPPPPEEEDFEVDSHEFFDSLTDEQLAESITAYIQRARAQTIPLMERLQNMEAELSQARRDLEQSRDDAARVINEFKAVIKEEREKNMELRNKIAFEHEHQAIPEPPVKVVFGRNSSQPPQRQSGGSSGAPRSTVVIHRKPRTENMPKGARDALNRNK